MSSTLSVLLVGQLPQEKDRIIQQLDSLGFIVDHRTGFEDALEAVNQQHYEIILVDQTVEHRTGLSFCERLEQRGHSQTSYVIYLSHFDDPAEMVMVLDTGAQDFISKPLNRLEIYARLKAACKKISREQKLVSEAMTDPLTGLANRRQFAKQLELERNRSLRYGHPFTYIIIDVDHFKSINDVYGHQTGDQILIQIAKVICENARKSDIISRQGGDEFCVLLPQTTEENAKAWLDKVKCKLSKIRIGSKLKQEQLSISAGLVQINPVCQPLKNLLDRADQALLTAKHLGRNRSVACGIIDPVDMNAEPSTSSSEDPLQKLKAGDIMSTAFISLKESQSVAEAARMLLQLRTSSTPVVDEEGHLVGIVSEKDVLLGQTSENFWSEPVSQVMTKKVISYQEETPLRIIHDFLCRSSIRRVIVVSGNKPVGMISRGTTLRWLGNWDEIQSSTTNSNLIDKTALAASVKDRLWEIIQHLSGQVNNLQSSQSSRESHSLDHNSLVPVATRIQELSMDLLSLSGQAKTGNLLSADPSIKVEGSFTSS